MCSSCAGFNGFLRMMTMIVPIIIFVVHRLAEAQTTVNNEVTFSLYTGVTANESMVTDDVISMTTPNFNPCAETIILITGLNQKRDSPDMIASAEIIAGRHFNVIVVNYNTDSYVREVPKTVSKIVEFLKSLEKQTGFSSHRITLIGISLGAHIAGQVGRLHRIGRIIGVDPSGPLYDVMGDVGRLDASDAEFVDVVHTSKVLGSLRNIIGHVNYVVNGGFGQPMCKALDPYCHHVRGAYLLLASFTICNIQFRQCFSYWAFRLGLCNSWPTINFGLALDHTTAPRKGSLYYYETPSAEFPYCGVKEQQFPKLRPLFC